MSIIKAISIVCDECGEEGPTEVSVGEAIRRARSEEWKVGRRHRCPDCSGAEPEASSY